MLSVDRKSKRKFQDKGGNMSTIETSLVFTCYAMRHPLGSRQRLSATDRARPVTRVQSHFAVAAIAALLATLLTAAQPVNAQPTITTCTSGINGKDIAISKGH